MNEAAHKQFHEHFFFANFDSSVKFLFWKHKQMVEQKTCDDDISAKVNIRRERLELRSNVIKTFDSENMFNCIVSLESAKSLAKNKKTYISGNGGIR